MTCILLLIVNWSRSGFAHASYTRKLTVQKEIFFVDSHIKKSFLDASNLQEVWQWIHGPMVAGLFEGDDGFESDRTPVSAAMRAMPSLTQHISPTSR